MTLGALGWLNAVGAPLLVLDDDGALAVAMNAAARQVLAASGDLPTAAASLLGAALHAEIRRVAAAGAPPGRRPTTIMTPGGTCHVAALAAPAGGWLVTLPPFVADAAAAGPLGQWRADWATILDALPVAVEVYDGALRELFANRQAEETVGFGAGELPTLVDWWDHAYREPEARAAVERAWNDAVAASRATGSAVAIRDLSTVTCKDGSEHIIEARYRALGDTHLMVYWDVSEDRRIELELRHLAERDPLTGLYNRRSFEALAADALTVAIAAFRPLSVLMLDLDRFKAINDFYGHGAGDAVLRGIADRCRGVLRRESVMARLGGEEFAVLLPGIYPREARATAERIRAEVAEAAIPIDGGALAVTLSIGCATSLGEGDSLQHLLSRADVALYEAKKAGRNCVRPRGG